MDESALEPRTATSRLELLDALRLVAALSVVSCHWLYGGIVAGKVSSITLSSVAEVASYGYLGVYLFFLISGFVIAASVKGKTPAQFAVGRLLRLYPAYWAAMLITVLVTVAVSAGQLHYSFGRVFANLTMVSRIFGQPYVDGVYWTLFLELLFYAAIWFLLLVGQRDRLDAIMIAWSALLIIVEFGVTPLRDALLAGGIFSFFAAGAVISAADRRGWTWWRALAVCANLVVSVRFIVRNAFDEGHTGDVAVIAGIIVACYGVLALQTVPRVRQWRIPGSRTGGNLTYPVYLLHASIGYAILDRWATDANKWWVYGLLFVGLLLAAYSLHVLIEVRCRSAWKRLFTLAVGQPIDSLSRALHRQDPRLGGLETRGAASSGASARGGRPL